jgi:hypothetical protein
MERIEISGNQAKVQYRPPLRCSTLNLKTADTTEKQERRKEVLPIIKLGGARALKGRTFEIKFTLR